MPEIPANQLEIFALIFIRVSTMLILMPVLSTNLLPKKIKIIIALLTTFILFPTIIGFHNFTSSTHLIQFFILVPQEIFFGVFVAFFWQFIFFSLRIAGSIAGFQMGFFVASVIDPDKGSESPIISELYYIAGILLFLALNGHHRMIESLIYSFQEVPFGKLYYGKGLINNLINLTQSSFETAIKISLPILATLLLVEVGLGLIARVAPQINILMVGFPLKIGIGIIVLMYSIPFFSYIFSKSYSLFSTNVFQVIKILGGR